VRIRVLIAEDNASVRVAMRRVLERLDEHWEVIEAENGEDALAKAQDFRPDLIVLDLVMPQMDGLTASREIAKVLLDVPILLHTLYSSPELQVEAGKVGVRRVVPKSNSGVLVSAVQDLVHSKLPTEAVSEPISADMVIPKRRKEDRIRDLCTQLHAMKDEKSQAPIFVELREALHQHVEQLRATVARYPVVVDRRVRQENAQASNVVPSTTATPEQSEQVPIAKTSTG
jgi:DNA-binding NarL/FixJ family response regulator